MKEKVEVFIFASEQEPVSKDVFELVIDFLHSCKENELRHSFFGRFNVSNVTPTNLNLKIATFPGCYDVILGPCPTAKFIVPQSDALSQFLQDYKALTKEV